MASNTRFGRRMPLPSIRHKLLVLDPQELAWVNAFAKPGDDDAAAVVTLPRGWQIASAH